MKSITQSDKELLRISLNFYVKAGVVCCRIQDVEQELFDIFEKRLNNGSSRRRASRDAVYDMVIKYDGLPAGERNSRAELLKMQSKMFYYEKPCILVAYIMLMQLTSLVTSLFLVIAQIVTIPGYFIALLQAIPTLVIISIFIGIYFVIKKDRNYNTDEELRYYSKIQLSCICFTLFLLPLSGLLVLSRSKSK